MRCHPYHNVTMLFNSFSFLFLFLPLTVGLFFLASRFGSRGATQLVLSLSSLAFYSAWEVDFLPLLLVSLFVNYAVSRRLYALPSKALLSVGVAFNLLMIGVFKYADFFSASMNLIDGVQFPLLELMLPLVDFFFYLPANRLSC